jgi:hypothetical protein
MTWAGLAREASGWIRCQLLGWLMRDEVIGWCDDVAAAGLELAAGGSRLVEERACECVHADRVGVGGVAVRRIRRL